MKTSLMILSLVLAISTQANAASFGMTTFLTNGNFCKEAVVINEGNEYLQTGVLGASLSVEVQAIQLNSDLSVAEAVDLIMADAQESLENN